MMEVAIKIGIHTEMPFSDNSARTIGWERNVNAVGLLDETFSIGC